MKVISITVDGTTAQIETQSRVMTILNYGGGCDMTVCYSKDWAPSRAIQHAISIIEAINNREIV